MSKRKQPLTYGIADVQFQSGLVRLPIDAMWTIDGGAKSLNQVAASDNWSKGWKGLGVVVNQPGTGSFIYSNSEFSDRLIQSAQLRAGKGKLAEADFIDVFDLDAKHALPKVKLADAPTAPSLVIEKRKPTGIWVEINNLPTLNPPGWWEMPLFGEYVRTPIEELVEIEGGLPALKQFINSFQWTASEWNRPILLHRPDTGGYYIFTADEFRPIAIEAVKTTVRHRDGVRSLSDHQLAQMFNVHKNTAAPMLSVTANPTERSIVITGAKPSAAWMAPTPVKQSDIPTFVPREHLLKATDSDEEPPTRGGEESHRRDDIRAMTEDDDDTEPPRPFGVAESVSDDTIRRTPHMDLSPEPPLAVNTIFYVLIYTDESKARPGEDIEPVVIDLIAGQREYPIGVWLVTSKHFKVLDEPPLKKLLIKTDESKSEAVVFRVQIVNEILNQQNVTISALFDYEGRPCGRVTRELGENVQPPKHNKGDSSPPNQPPIDSPPSGMAIEPNAQNADLFIDITNPNKSLRSFKCKIRTHLIDEYKDGVTDDWDLPDVTQDFVKTCFKAFEKKGSLDALRGAGTNLFECAPPKFQKLIWKLVDEGKTLSTISIVSEEPHIPWELMVPWRIVDHEEVHQKPLGQEYAVGRWLHINHILPPQRIRLQNSRVFSPNYVGKQALVKAADEAQLVLSLFDPGQFITPAAFDNLKKAMKEGGASVLHFICHGTSSATPAQEILLENGCTLSSFEIDGAIEFAKAFKETRPLVFLNACEVGRLQPALAGAGGFAKSFIRKGAGCVIAPLWSVKDTIAHEVATEFYETINKNPTKPFAEILSSIRAKAYDDATGGEDTYAAYCFYGDPLATRAT